MFGNAPSPKLKIVHIMTLNGRNGEYGGPVRVARELCAELNKRGHAGSIFAGSLVGAEPESMPGLTESYVIVKPILKRFTASTLWSWRLIPEIRKIIISSDIVHIHFARDLVPFLASFISIIYQKPFVTQTHGMIVPDRRLSTRLTDSLLTRPLMNKSKANLVLTHVELSSIQKLKVKSPSEVLPNGIALPTKDIARINPNNRVIFCSRLHKRKGIDKFIELADIYRDSGIKFEIYGPDSGELALVESEINSRKLDGILSYMGALPANKVEEVLAEIDLLILPSKDEPFPMVVLEALALGTPVLIMPSCGFANLLGSFDSSFVATSEDIHGLVNSFRIQKDNSFQGNTHSSIVAFCEANFAINRVVDQLIATYKNAVSHAG